MQHENRQTHETVNLLRQGQKGGTGDKQEEEKSGFKVRALQGKLMGVGGDIMREEGGEGQSRQGWGGGD